MRFLKILALCSMMISCSSTSSINNERIYLDETGKSISEEEFQWKWRNKENDLVRWDVQTDSGRVAQLNRSLYEQYVVSYEPFLRNIEKLTGRELDENTILLINYRYVDDLCSSSRDNSWRKPTIRERKRFLDPVKAQIEEQNPDMVFLYFFEEGISLSNNPTSEKEYFYMDSDNFLRNSLFRNPTLCGSYALIKPNGQVLIRNGENRPDRIAEFLKPEKWELFFN